MTKIDEALRRLPLPTWLAVGILCLLGGALLSFAVYLHPVWGSMLGVLIPVPAAAAFILGGIYGGLTAVIGAAALIAAWLSFAAGAAYFVETGLMAALIAYALRRRLPYPQLTVLVSGFVLLAHLGGGFIRHDESPNLAARLESEAQRAEQSINDMIRRRPDEKPESGMVSPEIIRTILETFFSSLFVIGVMLNSLFAAIITGHLGRKVIGPRPPFTEWRLPEHLIWVFIGAAFIVVSGYRRWYGIPAGLLLTVAFLYAVQGAAVSLAFADKKGLPLWLRLFFLVLVAIQPIFLAALLAVGLIDFKYDFRAKMASAAVDRP